MKVERTTFPGWNNYPCYRVRTIPESNELCRWMSLNQVENIMVSSGSTGYVYQIRSNIDLFVLKWA